MREEQADVKLLLVFLLRGLLVALPTRHLVLCAPMQGREQTLDAAQALLVNADDELVAAMASRTSATVTTFGAPPADVAVSHSAPSSRTGEPSSSVTKPLESEQATTVPPSACTFSIA